jgi:hypothetical protein
MAKTMDFRFSNLNVFLNVFMRVVTEGKAARSAVGTAVQIEVQYFVWTVGLLAGQADMTLGPSARRAGHRGRLNLRRPRFRLAAVGLEQPLVGPFQIGAKALVLRMELGEGGAQLRDLARRFVQQLGAMRDLASKAVSLGQDLWRGLETPMGTSPVPVGYGARIAQGGASVFFREGRRALHRPGCFGRTEHLGVLDQVM